MISRIDIEDMTDAQDEARVTVKPLVWHDCADGTSHDDDCLYEIKQDGRYWRLIRAVTGGGSYVGHHISREAAKAAANKYHDGWINYWIADLARPSQAVGERVAEGIAIALWREEAAPGTPSVQKLRNADTWVDQAPELRDRWMRFARAALAAAPQPAVADQEALVEVIDNALRDWSNLPPLTCLRAS